MFCAISGVVPEQPVIAKNGHVFEGSLITKYVKEVGKCPITGEPLTQDDLLAVKTNKTVKARPTTATSIPGLLGIFHDEWDALMLECHSLRSALLTTRQELSHCLYQHDAATRVIARLIKERDEARQALEDAKAHITAAAPAAQSARSAAPPAASRISTLSEEIVSELVAVNKSLTVSRKKRAISDSLATTADVAAATFQGSQPLHSTTAGGINALELHPEAPAVVATGGSDSKIHLYDYIQERVRGTLEGHSKKVTSLSFATPEVLLSASADKTIRVWRGKLNSDAEDAMSPASFTCAGVVREHTSEVVTVAGHPSRRHFVTVGADSSWGFFDLETLTCLKMVDSDASGGEACCSAQLHPDGLILGLGTPSKVVRIWELRQNKSVTACEGHTGAVLALAFSENGYHMASAGEDCVKLWDLRKIKSFKTFTPFGSAAATSVAYDNSGLFLAVGGPTVKVFAQKQEWDEVNSFSDVSKKATALRWGQDGRSLLLGSADHNLRVFASPSQASQKVAKEAAVEEATPAAE